ncbi:MFS transporter [Paenibacillus thiaminolyticus]|uniref:MFS transporter n=1 Tax=Paenibacillus thiaminolyticus TaxID=49283 RepID=A0AAP9J2U1_PANTH|nr:MFS transporter [Paenibacillus thiaminolyticus]MCY9536219.1 MFS transporter [Paenibacillus thiaminolyticus]MCY9603516.1 MFS transporter [Paenibacillus thiaminolyticus]MCY9605650.1 MFS transporter [Paenibacillus thiaminolyticus]MCY9611849.1 MFS transporter [Paenibacillus thiaminolyticus]MCY9620952.1 MFS transporter [Paenibacillus thiaminolyticus]
MRSVLWLYLFLFVAFFDLHAQYPILTPFAISIGAAPSFIGLMMGMYSFTHLPGNLLAGYGIDRFGSRIFIVFSLIGAGIIMILQAHVVNPWELLVLRSISGFVLAFLSPACLSLLARMARDHVHQGKLMAGNGLIHTLASVVSPAAGAYLVAKIGFGMAFQALGIMLLIVGVMAWFFIRDTDQNAVTMTPQAEGIPSQPHKEPEAVPVPWRFYFMPLAISLSQGILFFELPLMADALESIMRAGILFSAVSLGALFTLSLLFLNHYQPYTRTWMGAFALALLFFGMAIHWPVPLLATLFLIGMTKGIILPAMTSHLILLSGGTRFGRIFSILAIASSIGSFLGPMIAGQIRDTISPYFIAFVVLMIAVTLLPAKQAFLPPSLLPAARTTTRV